MKNSKYKPFVAPVLILLVSISLCYIFSRIYAQVLTSAPIDRTLANATTLPDQTATPKATPSPIIEIPEADTTNWKTFTEVGPRYSSGMNNEWIKLSNYRKYTFKYPANWYLQYTESKINGVEQTTIVTITAPSGHYTININYIPWRDYGYDIAYTLTNGMTVENEEVYGKPNSDGIITPISKEEYIVNLETVGNTSHDIAVSIPILNESKELYAPEYISIGRAIVKSFDLK